MYRIMIIEDDKSLSMSIATLLKKYQFETRIVNNFHTIITEINEFKPHVILLDINLPLYDGFYWCRKIRNITTNPIIIMSAKNETFDQVRGIESGADDYLIKPFDFEILLAKVNGIIRRSFGEFKQEVSSEEVIIQNDISLFLNRQILKNDSIEIELSLTECKILQTLLLSFPDFASRNDLFMSVWESEDFIEENTLNVNIRRIRNKLLENNIKMEIKTLRSYGYKLIIKEGKF